MYNVYLFVCTSLICLILMPGCNASKNNQKDTVADSTGANSTAMKSDSFPPPPKPGPAPGHARIQAELVDIAGETARPDYITITFLVKEVQGYGASTPPLAVSDSVRVSASKSMIEEKKISLGKIVSAVISYRQFVLGGDTSPRWTLVTLD